MIPKLFLLLSAILFAVFAIVYFLFDKKVGLEILGASMIAFALHIICFLIWGTEVEEKRH